MDDTQRLQRLLEAFQGARRAILMTHDNPDPDSLAAALALQTLLNETLTVPVFIVYGGILGRAENRTMVKVLGIQAIPVEALPLQPDDSVALLDTQPQTGNNFLPHTMSPTVVLDLHPLRSETEKARFYDVRENFGASATLVRRRPQTSGG